MNTRSKIIYAAIAILLSTLLSIFVFMSPTDFVGYFKKLEVTQVSAAPLNNPAADSSQDVTKYVIESSQNIEDVALGQYAINMMFRSVGGNKLSDGKKQILARAIVRVSNDIFINQSHKRAFIAVLEIESGFQRFAQSPTGPKGYAQLAKASFHEAMASCGVTGLKDEDVWETDLNLYAGACYFRMMLERHDNDPFIAIVAYNQGPASESAKMYSKYGSMNNTEALKYVAKFSFLQRTTTDAKLPNVPAIEDLPTAGPSIKMKSEKVKK